MLRRLSAVVMSLLLTAHAGCLTPRVIEKFEVAPIEAAWAELLEANPNKVRLSLSIEYRASLPRTKIIEFDPRLGSCTVIRVRAQTRSADVYLEPGVRHPLSINSWEFEALDRKAEEWRRADQDPGDCTVAILFSTYGDHISLSAKNAAGRLGQASIQSPKRIVVLALLLPASAVVDVATFVPLLLWTCFSGDIDCTWMAEAIGGSWTVD
jgi:hypothetical protein